MAGQSHMGAAAHGLHPYLGTIPRPVYGPYLHEVSCGGLDFGMRWRRGHVLDSRVPIIRDVVSRAFDSEDRWANTQQIRVRVLDYDETVKLIAYAAERRAAPRRAAIAKSTSEGEQ